MRIMSIQSFHDSSVTILNDGKLEYFFKEERYTRKKRQSVPYKAILKALEVTKGEIDHVIIDQVKNNAIPFFVKKFLDCPIHDKWDSHHMSHGWLAYYNSGFEGESLVFVIDREGSNIGDLMRECESVLKMWYPSQTRNLQKNFWLHNKGVDYVKHYGLMNNPNWIVNADTMMGICKVYESANTLIGQNEFESGKTMGLAAYGKDQPHQSLFHDDRPVDSLFIHDYFPTKSETKSFSVLHKKHVNKITLDVPESDYQFYADYAYQVQKQTQEQVLNLVKTWVAATGIKQVCLSGGYFMNVVTNAYLVKNLPDVNFYFEPLADDTGLSIGQALHFYHTMTQSTEVNKLENI